MQYISAEIRRIGGEEEGEGLENQMFAPPAL